MQTLCLIHWLVDTKSAAVGDGEGVEVGLPAGNNSRWMLAIRESFQDCHVQEFQRGLLGGELSAPIGCRQRGSRDSVVQENTDRQASVGYLIDGLR